MLAKYLLPTLGGVFYAEEKGVQAKHTGRHGLSTRDPWESIRPTGQRTGYSDPLKFNFIELIILADIGCKSC